MKAIITFHSIDNSDSVLSYKSASFADLIRSLSESDIPILNLNELLNPTVTKGVSITFDDGMKSVFTEALPILRDFDIPAHLYLTTSVINKNNQWATQPSGAPYFEMLSWDEIEELHSSGIYIESHTNTHPDMRQLNYSELENECSLSDNLIEQRLGRRPEHFAYPYGYSNKVVNDYVRNRYKTTVTTEFRILSDNDDSARLPRLDSYYLQPKWLRRNIFKPQSNMYLKLRGWMRTVRGSQ